MHGSLTLVAEQEARGMLITMKLIEDLTLDEVKRWYNIAEKPDPERAQLHKPAPGRSY